MAKLKRNFPPTPSSPEPHTPKSPSGKMISSQEAFAIKARIDQLKKQVESKVAKSPEKAAKILSDWLSKKK